MHEVHINGVTILCAEIPSTHGGIVRIEVQNNFEDRDDYAARIVMHAKPLEAIELANALLAAAKPLLPQRTTPEHQPHPGSSSTIPPMRERE